MAADNPIDQELDELLDLQDLDSFRRIYLGILKRGRARFLEVALAMCEDETDRVFVEVLAVNLGEISVDEALAAIRVFQAEKAAMRAGR